MKFTETSKGYILEGEQECPSCKGTGLYKGLGEADGACVVCYNCDGTGRIKVSVKYAKFKGRKKMEGCNRVYTQNMGYGISDKDITGKGGFFPFSKYGCSYEDWLKGVKPLPLKFLGCPFQETNQGLKSEDANGLYKTRCKNNSGWGTITDCKLFHNKKKCWEIFEKK